MRSMSEACLLWVRFMGRPEPAQEEQGSGREEGWRGEEGGREERGREERGREERGRREGDERQE